MKQFALLTLTGRDQPGIVARTARVLFESGCNIEDSSMTQLRGQFTIMLVLGMPEKVSDEELRQQLQAVAGEMELLVHLSRIEDVPSAEPSGEDADACYINVLGADKPGIVYRVTRTLEEVGGNIIDLQTQTLGSAERPVYAMIITAELAADVEPVRQRMLEVARDLGVEITVRDADAPPL
ncbi:MAG: amino acid-binding protein [Magnetococcales bacterium]|nr:amino acid-binding protein [Magnetococcales bacterium]